MTWSDMHAMQPVRSNCKLEPCYPFQEETPLVKLTARTPCCPPSCYKQVQCDVVAVPHVPHVLVAVPHVLAAVPHVLNCVFNKTIVQAARCRTTSP